MDFNVPALEFSPSRSACKVRKSISSEKVLASNAKHLESSQFRQNTRGSLLAIDFYFHSKVRLRQWSTRRDRSWLYDCGRFAF
jgi:hypothetical protein